MDAGSGIERHDYLSIILSPRSTSGSTNRVVVKVLKWPAAHARLVPQMTDLTSVRSVQSQMNRVGQECFCLSRDAR